KTRLSQTNVSPATNPCAIRTTSSPRPSGVNNEYAQESNPSPCLGSLRDPPWLFERRTRTFRGIESKCISRRGASRESAEVESHFLRDRSSLFHDVHALRQ